jgi:hypothetical protein
MSVLAEAIGALHGRAGDQLSSSGNAIHVSPRQ